MGNMPVAQRFSCYEGTCQVLMRGIMLHNKSVNADAQGRPAAAPRRAVYWSPVTSDVRP